MVQEEEYQPNNAVNKFVRKYSNQIQLNTMTATVATSIPNTMTATILGF